MINAILQGISVLILTLLQLTRKPKLPALLVVMAAASTYLVTTIIDQREDGKRVQQLRRQTAAMETQQQLLTDVRDRLFELRAPLVMKAPKATSTPTPPPVAGSLRITFPEPGAAIPARVLVQGWTADVKAATWVVVHPMESSAYWVQPRLTVKEDGTWSVLAYLGRSGAVDRGKRFEIMAIARPQMPLQEADVLPDWPKADWRSNMITLIRQSLNES